MENKRYFEIETPLGKIKVHAKHETDSPLDYPGIYIEFEKNGFDSTNDDAEMLAVVEYDPMAEDIIATLYADETDMDTPSTIQHYPFLKTDPE